MADCSGEYLHIRGDSKFQQRSNAVFSCLDNLEPHSADIAPENDTVSPLGRCKKPDHVLHPERWKKYSLEDVKETVDGLSGDELNRHTALSFLEDLRKRKAQDETRNVGKIGKQQDELSDTEMEEKIVFSKDVIKKKMEVEEIMGNSSDVAMGSPSQHVAKVVVGLSHLQEVEKESDIDD